MEPARTVSVLLPLAVDGPYTYRQPAGLDLAPGDIVRVPLGPREIIGAVWDDPPDASVGHNRLRPVSHRYDSPPLDETIRKFVDWVAHYTLTPRGMVLRMVLRAPDALEPERETIAVRRTGVLPDRATAARQRVLDLLADGAPWPKSGLAAAAGVSSSVVTSLIEQGVLETFSLPPPPLTAAPDPDYARPVFDDGQDEAAATLRASVDEGAFSVTLIDGVTGSGKTEVYFEALAETLRKGRQALVLLPEIALTNDFLERFTRRFGERPAEWHSELAPRMRERVWRGVASGEVRAVIGARSALFLPFRELGLVVVDEEHDTAYKQDEGVIYNARDMAVVRGHIGGFPVVLSSATPSIESRVNADQGRYRRIVLTSRYAAAKLPDIHAVDLRVTPPEKGHFLAPPLVAAMEETIAAKGQVLLFLNRRGYAPLTLCRACGHRFQCPNCSTWLVEHRFRGQLVCHHCGHTEPRPDRCPVCDAEDSLVACGPGVERIAEEVETRFPDARRIVLSSDILGGVKRMRLEFEAIRKGEADIIIGTQLVAKGHNFPLLALVGVVDADLGLAHGDPRAAERTFQLLAQVTGRAGRAGGESRAFLQTYAPEHPVIAAIASGDREAFYAREIEARRVSGLPPFGRLAGIIVSAADRATAFGYATALRRAAPETGPVMVLGPSEAPLAVLRGRHRFRLLLQAPRNVDMQAFLRSWLTSAPPPRGSIKVQVDIDPQSFM
ncbi:primosomal protein N' [Kaistia dalseonensis]|uniref:Replication restart protein PriA n=1 Tax=Kaistia dalseonensis TaxID=410840 RepID=A0ABU0H5V5_9HYPH|nr:primosomal protein N' [Kaistia dalseonensis]MCX5495107.1 primosomal protein N' [Kaistia dalseonensis]MDQ0437689.1 primosomal protein N' (replication factor Y) [Kaistia dalseonensis]